MSPGDLNRIRFEVQRKVLSGGSVSIVVVFVGARAIAERLFRHDPPTPGEIEQAIDEVKDALAATGLKQALRGDLEVAEPKLLELLGLRLPGERVTRGGVEARVQLLGRLSCPTARDLSLLGAGQDSLPTLLTVRQERKRLTVLRPTIGQSLLRL